MHYSDFAGFIFDVDDTLLDNLPHDPVRRMHERSRLVAVHEVGHLHGIKALQNLSAQENLDGFLNAPIHSLESAVWNILFTVGVVATNTPDPTNKIFQEIIARKSQLYEKILREEGQEVPGASAFVKALAAHGFKDKMAIASTAVRSDIDIFLEKVGLTHLFPEARIIAKNKVTHLKPHPEAFETAFNTLGLPNSTKSKVAVFEDDPRGIMAAKAAGLFVFAITVAYDPEKLQALEVPPDVVGDSYAEFSTLLRL